MNGKREQHFPGSTARDERDAVRIPDAVTPESRARVHREAIINLITELRIDIERVGDADLTVSLAPGGMSIDVESRMNPTGYVHLLPIDDDRVVMTTHESDGTEIDAPAVVEFSEILNAATARLFGEV